MWIRFKRNLKQYSELDQKILNIALPCAVENLLVFAVGLVMAAMIGRLSSDEITIQSICSQITSLFRAFFSGLGVGATVILSICYGSGSLGRCRKIAEQIMLIVLPMSLVAALTIRFYPMQFLRMFLDDETLIQRALPYLHIVVWSIPFVAVSRIITAVFTSQGDTKTPMVIAVTVNVVSAALGYVLIFGLGPIQGKGMIGAAWSQTVAYGVGTLMGLAALYMQGGLYCSVMRDGSLSQLETVHIRNVFTTGIPASLESMMMSVAAIILSRVLISYGTVVNSGYQLSSQVEGVLAAPCFGFQLAATTLVAQSLGRGSKEDAANSYKRISFWCVVVTLPVTILLLVFPNAAMMLLTDKPEIRGVGVKYLMTAAVAFVPQALGMVDFGAIRAAGHKRFPLAGTMIGMWCVRVPIAALAAWVFEADIFFVFCGYALDQIVRKAIAEVYQRRHRIFSDV